MRYAIFSDIHGNLQAWNAVLADMDELEADILVCLGDVVGYGPCPQQVLSEIRAHTDNFVVGNHDAAASGALDPTLFNPHARSVIEWTREQLDAESIDFLLSVPLSIETEDILFVHAEIAEPARFGYIDDVIEAAENFAANLHHVTFVGHTHNPTIFELNSDGGVQQLLDEDCTLALGKRYIVNVGSVGEPRNPEDIRGRYVIYDSDTRELYFRRIVFDPEAYRADLHASGLGISPYFLSVVDHYIETASGAANQASARAMEHDMEPPLELSTRYQRQVRQLVIPTGAGSGHKPRPKPVPNRERRGVGPAGIISILGMIGVALVIGAFFLFGSDDTDRFQAPPPAAPAEIAEVQSRSATAESDPDPDPNAGPIAVAEVKPAARPFTGSLRDGLLLHSQFDDSPGTKWLLDSSGADRDLTSEGAESAGSGVSGRAFKFDGVDDRLVSGPDPIESLEAAAISGWFSSTSQGVGRETIVSVESIFVVEFDNGKLFARFDEGIETRASSPAALRDGFWRHFVAQNDGATTKLYVDGKFANSVPQEICPLDKVANRPIAVGAASHAAEGFFPGYIDEIAIWSRALTEAEIVRLFELGQGAETPEPLAARLAVADPPVLPAPASPPAPATAPKPKPGPKPQPPPPPAPAPAAAKVEIEPSNSSLAKGLIGFWNLDDAGAAPKVMDFSGGGIDLAMTGAKAGEAGQIGGAVRFDPAQKTNLATPNNAIPKSDQIAIGGWFKRQGKTRSTLVTIEGGINVALFDDAIEGFTGGDRNAAARTGLGNPDDKWRHFLVQNDGKTTTLYVNGVEKAKRDQAMWDPDSQDRASRFGAVWNASGGFFNGWMDEVAIWNRALTEEEIHALFATGNSAFNFLHPPEVLAHWKMDDPSQSRDLFDSLEKNHLRRVAPAASVAAIAPNPVPQTGAENPSALREGSFAEIEVSGTFQLSKHSSFTFEGWISADLPRELTFIAGTRTGDDDGSQGWHVDIRPPTTPDGKGAIGFIFDNGPEGKQVVAENVDIFDGQPHHFAACWFHDTGEEGVGQMRLFVDGAWMPGTPIAHSDIPETQANRFSIGLPGKAKFTGVLDEVRFTRGGLKPPMFLTGRKGGLEMVER